MIYLRNNAIFREFHHLLPLSFFVQVLVNVAVKAQPYKFVCCCQTAAMFWFNHYCTNLLLMNVIRLFVNCGFRQWN
jgi:hypothetical protein